MKRKCVIGNHEFWTDWDYFVLEQSFMKFREIYLFSSTELLKKMQDNDVSIIDFLRVRQERNIYTDPEKIIQIIIEEREKYKQSFIEYCNTLESTLPFKLL